MSELVKSLVAARKAKEIGEAIYPLARKNFGRKNTLRPVTERFFERLSFGACDCWFWIGRRNKDGYGVFNGMGEKTAHRASWVMHYGPIPAGMQVLHKCDAPSCVHPKHLFLGTHADNMADMRGKGHRKGIGTGESNGRAKLDAVAVTAIRRARSGGVSLKEIARHYGVATSTISRVVRWENWK